MDTSVIFPEAGGGVLTPKQFAKKFFEFFPTGSHREVLFLGDLIEQQTHYIRSKGHKVLCGARSGVCELCEKSDADDDVSTQQVEYYAATFVRPWREREFSQRVAVFSFAAGEEIQVLIPEGSARGRRIEVERYSQGNSSRFRIKNMAGLPAGFPAVLPVEFDVRPFVRARYGKKQDPSQPLIFLPPFRCESATAGRAGRPRPLALTAADYRPTDEVRSKLSAYAAKLNKPQPDPTPSPATPPTNGRAAELPEVVSVEVKAVVEQAVSPDPTDGPMDAGSAYEAKLRSIMNGTGQRKPGSIYPSPEKAAEALRRRQLEAKPADALSPSEAVESNRILDYVTEGKTPSTIPFSTNGHHKNGGAK